jgi:hypothetical protein
VFEIYDSGESKRYIQVVYQSDTVAQRELEELLRYYPEYHEWRLRLRIRETNVPAHVKVPKRKVSATRNPYVVLQLLDSFYTTLLAIGRCHGWNGACDE